MALSLSFLGTSARAARRCKVRMHRRLFQKLVKPGPTRANDPALYHLLSWTRGTCLSFLLPKDGDSLT